MSNRFLKIIVLILIIFIIFQWGLINCYINLTDQLLKAIDQLLYAILL